MAYSTNPNLPRARALALKLLINEGLPLQVVANKCGVHRSTIYRWKHKWLEINQNIQLENFNRPTRNPGSQFRATSLSWLIPTSSSKPKYSPNAIPEHIVELVISLRIILKRCAEVVWFHLTQDNGVNISISSVRRILKRHHYINGRKKRVRPSNPIRPNVTKPGELVQTDTIHYVDPLTKRRKYVYTVIDLYTRMTYAEIHSHIRPGIAASTITRAELCFGFKFNMVQADNGPEYSHYFEDTLARQSINTRHSRLHRPNDNAHIERYNRTIQDECLGRYLDFKNTNKQIQAKLNKYLEFYNNKRVHLSLQYRTPSQMLQSS
ncbi:MAG: integrase core domain-containing protein [Candidatus Saccharimonadales bacterium]